MGDFIPFFIFYFVFYVIFDLKNDFCFLILEKNEK
jgi:hypothetical protein